MVLQKEVQDEEQRVYLQNICRKWPRERFRLKGTYPKENRMTGRPNVLILGHFGMKNIGDEAMLVGILYSIRELSPSASVRIMPTSRGANFCGHLIQKWQVDTVERALWPILRSLLWADVVILGGGTHFHDFRGNYRYVKILLGFCIFFTLAKLLRKKVAYLGIGIGPLCTWWGKRLVRYILALADLIAVRERCSYETANCLAGKKKVIKGFDPSVFLYRLTSTLGLSKCIQPKVLGCSILPYYSIYEKNPTKDNLVINSLAQAIGSWLSEDPAREARIIVFRGPSKEDDYEVSRRLLNQLPKGRRVALVPYTSDPQYMLRRVMECDLFIATRFHSILFAYLAGLPMIVLSYHPKCKCIAEEIELPDKAILPIEFCTDAGKIASLLRAMSEKPDEFTAALPINKAIIKAETTFEKLKKLVEVNSCARW